MPDKINPVIKNMVMDRIEEDESGFWNLYVSDWTLESNEIDVSLKDISDTGERFPVRFRFDGTDADFCKNLKETYLNYDPVSVIAEYEKKNHTIYSVTTGENYAGVVMQIKSHLLSLLSGFSESSPVPLKKNAWLDTRDSDLQPNNAYTQSIDNLFRENNWTYDDCFTSENGQIIMWKHPLGRHDDARCAVFYDGTLKSFCDAFRTETKMFSPSDCVRYYRHSVRCEYYEDEIKLAENAKAVGESYQRILKVLKEKYMGDENYGT